MSLDQSEPSSEQPAPPSGADVRQAALPLQSQQPAEIKAEIEIFCQFYNSYSSKSFGRSK